MISQSSAIAFNPQTLLFMSRGKNLNDRNAAASTAAATVTDLLQQILIDTEFQLNFNLLTASAKDSAELCFEFSGPDTPLLLARNAELLLALEHLATQALRLETNQHHRVSFDAEGFKAHRDRGLKRLAGAAVMEVRRTGAAFHFRPMNSRERRLLHLALTSTGLRTESEGDGPMRHLVLHPVI